MYLELFLLLFWGAGWYFTIQFVYNLMANHTRVIKQNMISMIHSVGTCAMSMLYLNDIHWRGQKLLYNYAISNTSIITLNTTSNTSIVPYSGQYYYYDMLSVYNYLTDSSSIILLSISIFSMYYFIFDMYQIYRAHKLYEKRYYLWHHILMLLLHYYAMFSNNTYQYILLFNYGELSNLFTYPTYHYLKLNQSTKAYYCSLLQCMWFLYYRIWVYSSMLIPFMYSVDSLLLKVLLPTIYIMGFIWGFGLVRKLSRVIFDVDLNDMLQNYFPIRSKSNTHRMVVKRVD
jgi:hypothetical protein